MATNGKIWLQALPVILTVFLILAGAITMFYTTQSETYEKITATQNGLNEFKLQVATTYVDRVDFKELQGRVQEIQTQLASMDKKIDIIINSQKNRK